MYSITFQNSVTFGVFVILVTTAPTLSFLCTTFTFSQPSSITPTTTNPPPLQKRASLSPGASFKVWRGKGGPGGGQETCTHIWRCVYVCVCVCVRVRVRVICVSVSACVCACVAASGFGNLRNK